MTQESRLFVLAGAYFRPPANALIAVLPIGTDLRLEEEPTNVYDPFAVRVWARVDSVPVSALETFATTLEGYGFALEDLPEEIMLGYIGASGGKPCLREGAPGNRELPPGVTTGTLAYFASGSPAVAVPGTPGAPGAESEV